ncbi:adenylate/guanylate cyclase domain-containing protein [Spongiivirga citrea]|uniref:Adenylate/guanylate cyclase domain-containing protein n=1 Tax=Spongiivirga citrea TaxID=1481457 RepID=A0A6M0CQA1_9FLAO|nr:adenylate/guanylate cyclase domain-containing protein [Spongiivirga citrea]NER17677.1 adenylate/guanylate cyclase domain-containing protein [Spongiivirga citrea]
MNFKSNTFSMHPKYKRNLKRALSFGVIWFIFGLVYALLEYGLLGNSGLYPTTGNIYEPLNSFLFTLSSSFLIGFIQGWIEITWLRYKFRKKPFLIKIFFKSIFYLLFIILFLVAFTLVTNASIMKKGIFEAEIITSLTDFITSFAFWSLVFYMGVIIYLALFYSELIEHLGNEVLYNYSFGKYHKPKQETRIFMFLDMKSSTTIAEEIGHIKYFNLLKLYYSYMTNAILETFGEIYQYVGDEIVVTWPEEVGLLNNNCIECYFKIEEAIKKHEERFIKSFGLVPEFKAGYHIGKVSAGQIGVLKKEIVYTGDVLNTSARIQAECNNYNTRILISGQLKDGLSNSKNWDMDKKGEIVLRGKTEAVELYSISR